MIGIEPWFINYFVLYPGYEISDVKDGTQIYKDQYPVDLRKALDEGKEHLYFAPIVKRRNRSPKNNAWSKAS